MTNMARGRACALILCAFWLAACNAQIKQFVATPRHICAGESVQLSWDVVGSAHIRVTPPTPQLPDGPVNKRAQSVIEPAATTQVHLLVTRPFVHPTEGIQEIQVTSGTSTTEVLAASLGDAASSPSCQDGLVSATVHAKRFSPQVKVSTVVSHPTDARTYQVEHAGRSATVAPGEKVTAFRDTTLAGDWLLSTPVQPGQRCETVPPVVVINVITQCLIEDHP